MTALTISVDPSSPTPPYEQLRQQLAQLIELGTLTDGTRLPPVRQLAADLGLAAGTVARTYRELEAAGLVATRRGAGTRVRTPQTQSPAARAAQLAQAAESFALQAKALGASPEEASALITQHWPT